MEKIKNLAKEIKEMNRDDHHAEWIMSMEDLARLVKESKEAFTKEIKSLASVSVDTLEQMLKEADDEKYGDLLDTWHEVTESLVIKILELI